jgi:thiol-disulfide isomerase/thioredoxin
MTKSAIRLCILIILVSVAVFAAAQPTQTPWQKPDTPEEMQALLLETARNYREAKSLKIERVTVTTAQAELIKSWEKTFSNLALASGNRYRLEDKGADGWDIRQSDGTTEWGWSPWRKQYSEQRVEKSSEVTSNPAEGGWIGWLKQIDKKLAAGKLQPPETIEIDGRQVKCMVIIGPPSARERPDPSMKQQTTYWIDRDRKSLAKEEFSLHSTVPEHKFDYVATKTYNVVEFNPSLPDSLFKFISPTGAERVDSLGAGPIALVGKSAPPLKLKTLDGKDFDLASLRGKPLIVDFWATWCVPCKQSMPNLAKLYEEFKVRGLDLVSVSLDEDPNDAARYIQKHQYSWTHLADPKSESERDWGQSGIPRLLLIGKDGKVLFESDGYDEQEEAKLRSALHKMDPSFPAAESSEK